MNILLRAAPNFFFLLSAVEAAGIRAAYGDSALLTWREAQSQCKAWGGSLLKLDGEQDLKAVKCTDVLYVGAYKSPGSPDVDLDKWKWVSLRPLIHLHVSEKAYQH
jgi:hypothetical protein